MIFESDNDGLDHINIYSKGRTILGRKLSNFDRSEIILPEGTFQSIEGYWYYLLIEVSGKERLKELYGWEAKKVGREILGGDKEYDERFKEKIKGALGIKLSSDEHLKGLLKASTLPLAHYYVYFGKAVEAGHEWVIEYWKSLRRELHDNS